MCKGPYSGTRPGADFRCPQASWAPCISEDSLAFVLRFKNCLSVVGYYIHFQRPFSFTQQQSWKVLPDHERTVRYGDSEKIFSKDLKRRQYLRRDGRSHIKLKVSSSLVCPSRNWGEIVPVLKTDIIIILFYDSMFWGFWVFVFVCKL